MRIGPCEIFAGGKNKDGYGVQRFRGKVWKAHRVAWVKVHGPIPAGKEVMHRCDNPPCIRVSHLKLGTHRQNVQDCWAKGRHSHVGERNTRAVLTEEQVRYIRSFRRTPGIQVRLAAEFGVSKGCINGVRTKNRNWSAS